METTKKESLERAIQCLEALRNSPIVKDEYYINSRNLCAVIQTLTASANVLLDNGDTKRNGDTKQALELMYQIETISTIIQERLDHEDFEQLDMLIFHYNRAEAITECPRCETAYKNGLLEEQIARQESLLSLYRESIKALGGDLSDE